MLRLVADDRLPKRRAPRHVALCALDRDLAAYLERGLRSCWPRLRVTCAGAIGELTPPVDLWICGGRPAVEPPVPALWLGEVDQRAAFTRLSARLWRIATPVTGRQLVHAVEAILGDGC